MSTPQRLPAAWVDRLFDRLSATYGNLFLGRWAGQDLQAVKAIWAEELGGFSTHPQALAAALKMLPADAPNAIQFREIARTQMRDERQPPKPQLPAPPADPERVARAVEQACTAPTGIGPKDWAWRLKAREEEGATLSKAQRDMWREALRDELAAA